MRPYEWQAINNCICETNSDKNSELALMIIKSALEYTLKDQTEESRPCTVKVSSPTIILSIFPVSHQLR